MTAKVTFEIKPPENCSAKQLTEWIEYNLGASCIMPHSPISDNDLEVDINSLRVTIYP